MEKEEKRYLITGMAIGIVIASSVAMVIYLHKTNSFSKAILRLESERQFLKAEVVKANKRAAEMESLCFSKDACFKETISDGLRHGSSLSARHMADRKAYLHEINKVA